MRVVSELSDPYLVQTREHLEKLLCGDVTADEFCRFCLKQDLLPQLSGLDEAEQCDRISRRVDFLLSVFPDFVDFQENDLKISREISLAFNLWQMWIPMAEAYIRGWEHKQKDGRQSHVPYFVLLSGAQGSGKTVSTSVLKWLIPRMRSESYNDDSFKVDIISIDSLYKTNKDRIEFRNELRIQCGLQAAGDHDQKLESALKNAISLIRDIEWVLGTPREHNPAEHKLVERTPEEKKALTREKADVLPDKIAQAVCASVDENPYNLPAELRKRILDHFLAQAGVGAEKAKTVRAAAVNGNPFYEIARGLPNTHYVDQFMEIYRGLCGEADFIELPDFEKLYHGGVGDVKSLDRIEKTDFPQIFFLEGWFVGVPTGLNMDKVEEIIQSDEYVTEMMDVLDPERKFTPVMLDYLKKYQKIWDLFDNKTFLLIDDIRNVEQSRTRQEQTNRRHRIAELKAEGKTDQEISKMKLGMTEEEIKTFVRPYILLTYIILRMDPEQMDAEMIYHTDSSDYMPRKIDIISD